MVAMGIYVRVPCDVHLATQGRLDLSHIGHFIVQGEQRSADLPLFIVAESRLIDRP